MTSSSEIRFDIIGRQKIIGPRKKLLGYLEKVKMFGGGRKKWDTFYWIYDTSYMKIGLVGDESTFYRYTPDSKLKHIGSYTIEVGLKLFFEIALSEDLHLEDIGP
jgi:hypothetical protein